jgi:hypothetical protein
MAIDDDDQIAALVNKFKNAFGNLYGDDDDMSDGEIASDDGVQAKLAAHLHDELERFETKGKLTEPEREVLANLRQTLVVRDQILALAERKKRPN